ncbi:hypothetical protein LEP1GSC132_4007 [Leptospira kirschneri str. 200803703]|nr:hypothetical protein LEP1GSC132_4007 [Leptospira kirschneri str. 200803703]
MDFSTILIKKFTLQHKGKFNLKFYHYFRLLFELYFNVVSRKKS